MVNRNVIFAMACAFVAVPFTAQAQANRMVPTNEVVLTGYGTVGYLLDTQGENANRFTASISPVFLFQFQDRVLFEAEFEFSLQEGITETGLEYAQLDYIVNDNIVLVAGKFLAPFGVFSERLHPTWINKFASSPPIFGHHVAAFGVAPLMPILADVGVMARGAFTPGNFQVGINVYVTQGPIAEGTDPIPEVEFPASSSDNNVNKMVGGRIDVGLLPTGQISFSYLNGDYDDVGVLDFTAWNIAGEYRINGVEFRGEVVQTRQEIEIFTGFPTFVRSGFYAQAAYRIRRWEPVLRWTQIFDSKLDGVSQDGTGAKQIGLGLDYWIGPSIAVMGAYEINTENGVELDNDRFLVHVAFGF